MECKEVRDRFADHLNAGLPEPARELVHAHLAACPACREDLESLEHVWQRLDDVAAEPIDAVRMRARFDEMLDGYTEGLASVGPARPATGWHSRWSRLWPRSPRLQAGLAAAMLAIGISVGWLGSARRTPPPSPAADLTELRRELHDMREMLTLSLMQQQSATERLRGVSGSSQIEQPGWEIVRALLDTLLHDPNINVRLASVDALRRFAAQDVVQQAAVEALGESSFPLVQIAVIDLMVETRDKRAADALRRLSENSTADESVRGRAAWGLQQLSF